jgi:7-carboxy-7-deazaguanine synthase
MSYLTKSLFGPTLQGEGPHAGMPCVFVRLGGCNAWDGRPETRADSACPYCDTDFRGGEQLGSDEIVRRLRGLLSGGAEAKKSYGCVLTGGEPLLQADAALITALADAFAWVDIETNGTRPAPKRPPNVTVVCSPKAVPKQPIVVEPDVWKILIPDQQAFLDKALASGKPVFLQPTCPDAGPSGPAYAANVGRCVELCYRAGCRLSLQLHKYIGIE